MLRAKLRRDRYRPQQPFAARGVTRGVKPVHHVFATREVRARVSELPTLYDQGMQGLG